MGCAVTNPRRYGEGDLLLVCADGGPGWGSSLEMYNYMS